MVAIIVSLIAAVAALMGTFVVRRNHREMVKRSDEDRAERKRDADLRAIQVEMDRQCLAIENAVKRAAALDPHTQRLGFIELNALMDAGQVPATRLMLVEAVTQMMLHTVLESAASSSTPVDFELVRPKALETSVPLVTSPSAAMSADDVGIDLDPITEPRERASGGVGERVK